MQRITRRERYCDGESLICREASVAQCEGLYCAMCATFENNERNTRAEAIISQLIRCRDQVSLMQRDANTRSCRVLQSYKKSRVGEWAGGNSK